MKNYQKEKNLKMNLINTKKDNKILKNKIKNKKKYSKKNIQMN